MFVYVLSSMLDGELMFAVLDVAEVVFPALHCPPFKEHSLDVEFFPLPSLLFSSPFSLSPHLLQLFKLAHAFASCRANFVVLMYNDNKVTLILSLSDSLIL